MPKGLRPTKSYIVCMTQRTGSTYLCELLEATGVAGRPGEHFWREDGVDHRERFGVATETEVLERVFELGTTPNGVFGLKISTGGGYFASVVEMARRISGEPVSRSDPQVMASAFPDLRYLFLTRRDKVRQAVSWWKAAQTNVWHRADGESLGAEEAVGSYVFEAIDQLVQEVVAREAAWQRYFDAGRIRPLTIVYEDFVSMPAETVTGILRHLEIPSPPELRIERARSIRLADAASDEWYARYRETKEGSWKNKGW